MDVKNLTCLDKEETGNPRFHTRRQQELRLRYEGRGRAEKCANQYQDQQN